MSLVSVVMPLYNSEKYVEEAVKSVLAQPGELELIVVNDASTDRSLELVQRFADPRIKVINLKENLGKTRLAEVYNQGFRSCQGKYVAIIDSDDVLEEGSIQVRRNFLDENPKASFVFGTQIRMNEQGVVHGKKEYQAHTGMVNNQEFQLRWLLSPINPVGHGSVMYRKEVLDQFGGYNSDWGVEGPFLYTLARAGAGIGYVAYPTHKYRIHSQSISCHNRSNSMKKNFAFIEANFPAEPGQPLSHLPSLFLKGYHWGLNCAKDAYELIRLRK
ncbi:MAG: glycosyltransferase family 2 protein [Candidatus Woesearchaeota archaeon]